MNEQEFDLAFCVCDQCLALRTDFDLVKGVNLMVAELHRRGLSVHTITRADLEAMRLTGQQRLA